jgi:hypothetical protein
MSEDKGYATPRQKALVFVREVLLTVAVVFVLTAVVSYLLHRTTWYLFAEGLTIAGAAVSVFGAAGPLGFWNQTRSLSYQFGSLHTGVDVYERIRNEDAEAKISYRFMYLFVSAGALLIAIAILIHRIVD